MRRKTLLHPFESFLCLSSQFAIFERFERDLKICNLKTSSIVDLILPIPLVPDHVNPSCFLFDFLN